MNGNRKNGVDDGLMTFLAVLFAGVIAMPFVGMYLLFAGKSDNSRMIGLVLIIIYLVMLFLGRS